MAKKQQTETTEPQASPLVAENEALKAQNEQMLDMLVDLKAQVDELAARGPVVVEVAPLDHTEEAKLNAELDALKAEFGDYPLIDVFEQRVVLGQDASADIRLKGDSSVLDDPHGERCTWKLRWFNFGKEDRAQQAAREGYIKVQWDELQDEGMVATGARIDAFVRKGDRGLEVLHKIPLKLYAYKKKRDAARLNGLLQSEAQIRDHVANRVAGMADAAGDNASQAGDFAHGLTMSVTKGETERVTL